MQQQLLLSINSGADTFRWCWLHDGEPQTPASGNLEALRAAAFQPAPTSAPDWNDVFFLYPEVGGDQ